MVYRFTFFLFFSALISVSFSQNSIVRGPYLQSVTHESIIVMWRTTVPTASTVWYGTDSLALTQSVTVNGSHTNHMVKITGLTPSTRYYYAVGYGNTQLAGANSMHTFKIEGQNYGLKKMIFGDKTSFLNSDLIIYKIKDVIKMSLGFAFVLKVFSFNNKIFQKGSRFSP